MNQETINTYSEEAGSFVKQYEGISTPQVHPYLEAVLPSLSPAVLDVGAGSGRDAAWFAERGIDVVAVEPAKGLRAKGEAFHEGSPIHWVSDRLPELERLNREGYRFDFIMLSAVWMHIPPEQREKAFESLTGLLKPDGKMLITLRHGPSPEGRVMYPVSIEELKFLSEKHLGMLESIEQENTTDKLGRSNVYWEQVVTSLPGGYQAALGWLREIILHDRKSSTYKLGLVRSVKEALQQHKEDLREVDDFTVAIPLARVVSSWLRTYSKMSEFNIPQLPGGKKSSGVGVPKIDGETIFEGEEAKHIAGAFIEARRRIVDMPVRHVTRPDDPDRRVFKALGSTYRPEDSFCLNDEFIASFGELHLGKDLAKVLSDYGEIVEAGLFHEWVRLSSGYADAATEGEKVAMNRRIQRALYDREFIYFAHPVSLYDTPFEAKLEQLIKKAFPEYEIENPNTKLHARGYEKEGMKYFTTLCKDLQAICFTTFADGTIGAGVAREIETFLEEGKAATGVIFPECRVVRLTSPEDLKSFYICNVEESRARVKAEKARMAAGLPYIASEINKIE